MKIILHSLDELLQLAALVRGGTSTTKVGEVTHTVRVDASDFDPAKLAQEVNEHCATLQGQYEFEAACNRGQNELPHASNVETLDAEVVTLHLDGSVTTEAGTSPYDSEGLPWDETIHSGAKTTKGDGTWKRLRGVSDEVYEARRTELLAERDTARAAVADDAEPVATETHALPQDEPGAAPVADSENQESVLGPDLDALLEASQEAALDASDSQIDFLAAGRDFISTYSTAALNALKARVAPLEGNPAGKPMHTCTPGERRLMRACMDNYPLFV